MLTFRNTNLALGLLLTALLLCDSQLDIPRWAYVLPVLAYSLVVFYGVYFIQSGFFMATLYEGPPGAGRVVALTFDDGPSAEHTPRLLDILKENDLKAAFFCIGKNITGNEMLLQRMVQEGHVVGNHSFTHDTWFDLFPARRIAAELRETDCLIESLTGQRPAWFRPPYGVINPSVRNAVRQTGHRVIGWNVRSFDTMTGDNQKLMARLLRLLKPGAVVLLHDHGKKTLDVLPGFIRAARERGYSFERLDHLLKIEAYVKS